MDHAERRPRVVVPLVHIQPRRGRDPLVPKGCAWELRRGIDFTSSATVYGHDIHEDTDASSLAGALTAACLRARAALAKETTDG